MLPGVSNKHLMASWGTPETGSEGGCQATGPVSLSVQPLPWSLWICEGHSGPMVAHVSPEPAPGPVGYDLCCQLPGCPGLPKRVLGGDRTGAFLPLSGPSHYTRVLVLGLES